ncbi:AAA family ATPase [Curtobacterium sp. RRHDQ10]|uniref:helix-turn-helix transcriptional regulator n=1 Tax=Curtobacterium phyllosphaerae TaxID=3413379 RepID=UPI003BF3092D
MELVGRRPEVDRIATLAVLPRESALVVVGEPGLGKSSLLDAAATRARIPVVRVTVNASEARWPMSGVSTLFAALDDPRATAHAERLVAHAAVAGDTLAVAHELHAAVRDLALGPVLVLVDDADRMDDESQRLLAFLAGRLAGTAVRLVLSTRPACEDSPFSALPTLRLGPLHPDQALALARVTAPPEANDGVLAILAEETGGNPKALAEQLRTLAREQLVGREPLDVPLRPTATTEAVAELVLSCAGADQVDVLTRMALAPVVRTPSPAFDRDAVGDLADRDLIRFRGVHAEMKNPLVRSALHWRMPSRARRAAHAGLVGCLAEVDPRAALWHASFVDDVVDPEPLLDAAHEYAVAGLPFAAVAFTERALQVARGDLREQRGLLAVAEALLSRRFLSPAARYLSAIGQFSTLADDTRRLRLRYSVDYLSGNPVHADELLVPTDVTDPAEADALAGLLSMVACFRAETWETDSARELLLRAEPMLPASGAHTREVHQAAVTLVAAVDGSMPPDAELHDGLAAPVLVECSEATLLLLGHALSLSERYRSARRVFAIVLARASRTAPVWIEAARYLGAENEVRSGNHRQALRAIDAWEAGSAVVERLREPSRAIAIAWRHHAEGRPADALDVLELCLAHRSSGRLWGSTAKLHALRGRVLLQEDRVEDAITALEAADAIGRNLRNPTILRHTGDLVEAYVRAGRVDDARDLTGRLAADHSRRPSRWGTLVLARCRALVAGPAEIPAAYRAALDVFDTNDSQYERARTLEALAERLDRVGAREDRDKFVAAANAAYEAAGLRRPARPVAAPIPLPVRERVGVAGSTGVASAGGAVLTMLTPDERAVVQKVTEGYRNREIASSLYMSQRTVELRLTQIYRKVGARSRSHLVALLT